MFDLETVENINEAHEMLENFIKHFQENCEHPDVSDDWLVQQWAPGQKTGFEVKPCKRCHQIISRKTKCNGCFKEIIDNEINEGDGMELPNDKFYCNECFTC